MEKTFEVISIKWDDCKQDDKELHCLYCAYGDSPIYGRDVLLYIGKTSQELAERNKQHLKTDFERINNLSFRKGVFENGINHNDDIISKAESLLITMLKPSYNSSNIKNYNFNDKLYLILNKGNRGTLPLEVSNIWWIV